MLFTDVLKKPVVVGLIIVAIVTLIFIILKKQKTFITPPITPSPTTPITPSPTPSITPITPSPTPSATPSPTPPACTLTRDEVTEIMLRILNKKNRGVGYRYIKQTLEMFARMKNRKILSFLYEKEINFTPPENVACVFGRQDMITIIRLLDPTSNVTNVNIENVTDSQLTEMLRKLISIPIPPPQRIQDTNPFDETSGQAIDRRAQYREEDEGYAFYVSHYQNVVRKI
jgi:hypothetical protein